MPIPIDKDAAQQIIDSMNRILAVNAGQHGYTMRLKGKFLYHQNGLRFTLVFTPKTGSDGLTNEARAWHAEATRFGLNQEWLGKTFFVNRRQFTIVGLAPRRKKMPVVVKTDDGKLHVMEVEAVRQGVIRSIID